MTSCRLFLMLCAVLLSAGCTTQHYEITMTPKGESVERSLIVSKSGSDSSKRTPIANDELTRIAAEFGHAIQPPADGHHYFKAIFSRNMPEDVGGHGRYVRFDSPCGSVTGYIERFRGDDDLVGELDARRKAVGELVDLFDRWIEQEWGRAHVFPQMRKALTTTIRRDLENLSCLIYISSASERKVEDARDDLVARITQYLLEHDYLLPEDLPILDRALSDSNEKRSKEQVGLWMQTLTIRLCGLPDDQTTRYVLRVVADAERFQESLRVFLSGTPEYRELKRIDPDNNDDPDKPFEVLVDPIHRAFLPKGALRETDHVALRLNASRQPYGTNGIWNPETAAVHWDLQIEDRDQDINGEIPRLCYAVWAEPKEDFQKSHFGQVVFTDQDLFTYCVWYRGLTPEETKEWDAFIESLQPGEALVDQLRGFRFQAEVPDVKKKDQKSLAAPMIDLIRKKIGI